MIRDITIGQYYPTNSIIHKLDARVKIVGTILFMISLFLFDNLLGYLIVGVFLAVIIKLSKIKIRYMLKGLKPVMFIILFTAFLNLFFTQGEIILSFWIFNITKEGIKTSIFVVLRIILLIIGSSLMTFTTQPNNLTDGMEKLLSPLNHIKVPVHEFAMTISIALRFIPVLVEETDKIMKAQTARGADFEHGNIIQRIKSMTPILVPLFVSAFRRANDLAMAMEARCYTGDKGRTKMKPLKYNRNDFIAYLVILIYILAVVILV